MSKLKNWDWYKTPWWVSSAKAAPSKAADQTRTVEATMGEAATSFKATKQAVVDFVEAEKRITAAISVNEKKKEELKEAFMKEVLKPIESASFFQDSMVRLEKEIMAGIAPSPPSCSEDAFLRYRDVEYLVFYPRNSSEGYTDRTINPGDLAYINVKSLLARFFITTHKNFGPVNNWRNNCIGVTSFVMGPGGNEMHMPMFDYDGKNIRTHLKERVKFLQENYKLGDAWVYQTKRGFHVYFFTDLVDRSTYHELLRQSHCCQGFQKAAKRNCYGTLRVSAKFTKFDIELEYVLKSKVRQPKRMVRKAHLVQELIRLGQECGTHFASLFPQWAHFHEDEKEWKHPAGKKRMSAEEKKASLKVGYGSKKIKKIKAAPAPPAYKAGGMSYNVNIDTSGSTTGSTSSNIVYTTDYNNI